MLRGLLREPLVHFLVVGGLLFALFGRNASELASQGKEIVVTAADLERLAGMFNRTWHRPPSEDELRAAVEDFVREEVLYRSAVSLGLDKDDTVIRRRLRQKMDFMSEDTVPLPRDAELHAFFDAHEDQFRVEALVSFRQIFFDTTRHQDAAGDASRLLQRLQSDEAKVDNEGDPFLLAEGYNATPIGRIAALFGDEFAHQLPTIEQGRWVGPLKSAFGLHLVQVTTLERAHLPSFEEVGEAVRREWFAAHRAAALNEHYQKLRANFAVRVADPRGTAVRQ